MKYKNILKVSLAALLGLTTLSGCVNKEWNEITELNLARCLVPTNLTARVDASKGDVVTFEWSLIKDAGGYELAVYTDEALTDLENSWALEPGQVPYTTRLTADKEYWFTVQAYRVDADGAKVSGTESKVSLYDGSFKTYAVKDNLYLEVKGRSTSSVSLAWSKDVDDFTEVTELRAVPVKGGQTVKKELSGTEAGAAAATIDGLDPSTEYQITLFYMSASRGTVDTWTKAEQGSAVTITTSDELKAAVTAGGNYYLPYNEAGYSMGTAKPTGDLTLLGELGPDGAKPVVAGKVELTADLAEANAKLYFENIQFDGTAGSRIVEHTGGSPVVESIIFVNCEITNYVAGFFYGNNDNVVKIGTLKFDSCDMYGIIGSGGDAVDIRKTTEIDEIAFVNNTMYDGIRTMFRIDASDAIKIGHIDFENNTVKNISTADDGNNRGFFAVRVPHEMTLKNNLFLFEDGGKKDGTDRAQLFQNNTNTVVPTFRNASGNYSYAHGENFFALVSAQAAGFVVMNVDPCYNSKGNFFQLAAQDLIEKKVGASKWWIQFVEKPEDLTQHVITEAHTWNLQNATLFAGDVKNSRVRDELMLVGTEATPLNADGGITFKQASVLTRKGVPTEGYASFKVNAPGSVDMLLSDPGKTGASVVVALYDDNGLSVLGGAVASSANPGVQKIVVPEVAGEGTVYLYSTGAVTITKLGWSKDVLALDKVLETPKPVVEPVTLTEGDETAVTISWEPIHAADHYVVVFNKRTQDPQTETSFTVPAEDIAALKAGLYSFTVQAFPAASDLYYQASEKGNASFAIQPKGGGGEVVQVTWTWDFSAADWQEQFATYGAAGADITNWNLTYDNLTIVSTAKSKYNTTYFQWGGKGSTSDRYMKFTAPEQGTLKVWASNTGGSEDLNRLVTVNQNGEEVSVPGGVPSSGEPAVCEFSVMAGDVYIYCTGNALRYYKVEFTYETGAAAAVEYNWDFSASDWQDALGALGAAGADITNIDLTVEGLTFHSGSKSKYGTSYIQFGGKSGDMDRYFKFTAPDQGTLKIMVSNTGSGEALDRTVKVTVGDDVQAQPGGFSSNSPSELEFSVPAGEVVITAPENGLRFYHIYYTNQ